MTEGTQFEPDAEEQSPDDAATPEAVTPAGEAEADDMSLTGAIAALSAEEIAEHAAQLEEAAVAQESPEDGPSVEAVAEAEADVETTDEIAGAIDAASQNVTQEPGLDDIAPGTVVEGHDEAAVVEPVVATGNDSVPWWPFLIYIALWIAFGVAMVYQLSTVPVGQAIYDAELYPLSVLAGLVLTLLGVVWIFGVWFATMRRPGSTKGGLFFSALLKGSAATLIGVCIWWLALVVLDQLRLGSML